MILRGWRIEGFGRFHGAEVHDLAGGLTVIEGPNEAGKSTLLGFVRFMLFGFARGERKYPPLEGGRHGGRLYFADAQGEWQLERFQGKPARLAAPDGRTLDEDALRAMLGRIDGAIFRDIFAFSLWELSNLEALSQEEVRDRLYSVGLTGAGKSASAARRALEDRIGELMKPRAESARINRLMSELAETRRKLREAQLQAQDYADLQRREAEADEAVQRLQAEAGRLRARREFLVLLRSVEGTWNRLHRLEEVLGRPADRVDPAQASKLAEELAAQKEREAELEQRGRDLQDLVAQIRELTPPTALTEAAPDVEELVRALGLQEDRLRREGETRAALEAKRREAEEAAMSLGLAADADVAPWDFSLRQEIDGWATRLRDREETVRRAAEDSERAARDAAHAAQEAQAAEAALAPHADAPDAATLEQRLASLDSLRRVSDALQRRRMWLLGLGAVGAALILAGAGGVAAGVSYLAAVLVLGLAVVLYAAQAAGRAAREGRQAGQAAAEEVGLAYPLPDAEIERLRRAAQAQREGAARREQLAQRAREATERHSQREAEAEAARGRLAAEEAQTQAAEEAFREFKRHRGLPAGLAPALLASYAVQLAEFARLRGEADRLAEDLREARGRIADFEAAGREQLRRTGREAADDARALLAAVGALGNDVAKARTAMERVADLGARRDGLQARLRAVEERRAQAELEIADHLARIGARDAAEFAILREAAAERAQFLDQAGGAADAVARELREGSEEERRQDAEAVAQRLSRIDEVEQKEALTHLLWLRSEREEIAQTADVAEYAAQEERILTDLRRAVAQWRAVFAAKRLLERTLEVYERDRQPEVLRFASQGLLHITGGRYVQVRQRTDERGLVAVDAAGELRTPEELSRGTAEQLYLALRLGLAASYGERVAALPLVLDDVLVNFDPERARAVLEVLATFAGAPGRQALLFTCHPFVREMAQAAGARILRLPAPLAAGEAAAAISPESPPPGDPGAAILAAIGAGELPLREIASAAGEPEAKVRREIEALVDRGVLQAVGQRRGRKYRRTDGTGLFEH